MQEPLINKIIRADKESLGIKKTKTERHSELLDEMHEIYRKKNADYGDSFGEVYREYGIISALTQIAHKHKRLVQLGLSDQLHVKDEAITDTLMDLANYAIMTIIELEKQYDN